MQIVRKALAALTLLVGGWMVVGGGGCAINVAFEALLHADQSWPFSLLAVAIGALVGWGGYLLFKRGLWQWRASPDQDDAA